MQTLTKLWQWAHHNQGRVKFYGYSQKLEVVYYIFILIGQVACCFQGGWAPNRSFRFHIKHRPNTGLIHVRGWEEGTLLFDSEEIFDKSNASLRGGRLGVFTYSQPMTKWSALRYRFSKMIDVVERSTHKQNIFQMC